MALIHAMRNVSGFEDSHHVPGHEKLGHDHSTPESWTTKAAVEELGKQVTAYKELNPGLVMIVGNCNIPDHKYHSYNVEGKMVHYSNSARFQGPMMEADQAFTKFPNEVYWVFVFTDRVLLMKIEGENRLKVKEKRLSP